MSVQYIIYGLYAPDGELRYIGQTTDINRRYRKHLRGFKKNNTHKEAWIKSLLNQGLKPEIKILQYLPNKQDLDAAEIYWIQYFRDQGCRLTNSSKGGNSGGGWPKGKPLSEETKRKLSIAHTGKKLSEEHKSKLSISHKGQKQSKESIKKGIEGRKKFYQNNPDAKEKHRQAVKISKIKDCIKLIDQHGNIYPSITEAAKIANTSTSNICKQLQGKLKRVKQFIFKKLENQ